MPSASGRGNCTVSEPGLRVEVAFALPARQRIVALAVEPGCTVLEAIMRSGLTAELPDFDIAAGMVGIFGRRIDDPATRIVQEGDRIELYRALLVEPRAARRQRARRAPQTP